MEIRLFFRKLTIFTLLIAFGSAILFYLIPPENISPAFPYMLAFFYLSSLGIYAVLAKSIRKRPAVFSTNFMFITVLKLFILMVFLGFYIYLNRDDAIPFVIGFFVLYIAYTVFETIEIMKLLKTIKPPENKTE
jgi:hypothetical protein